jgi:hypothetical protein
MTPVQVVSSALDELQYGTGWKYIAVRPASIGLGGQITARKDALRLALALGRTAVFPRLDDLPYTQTFEPMNSPLGLDFSFEDLPPIDVFGDQEEAIVRLDAMTDVVRGPTEVEEALRHKISSRLGLVFHDTRLIDGAILQWMRPTKAVENYVEAERRRLGINTNTLGVHLRRGDKRVESAFVPAKDFNTEIARLCETGRFDSLFLASDSNAAATEIMPPPGIRLIFDRTERRYNNANHKMLLTRPELADEQTRVAYKNIWLLSACGGLVGQDNAHFATLAAGAIYARYGSDAYIRLIDGRIAERRSSSLRAIYTASKLARALGRRLLPGLTTAARARRRGASSH